MATYLSNPIDGVLFTILAFFVGIASSMLGIGGGFITTPSLILIGVEAGHAIGTVLFVIIFIALSSTIAYARQKNTIEYRTGILVAFFTVIGAVIGSIISSHLATTSPEIFRVLFAICLLPIAVKMILFPKRRKEKSEIMEEIEHDDVIWFGFERREILSSIFGLIAGGASGLLGIGGGVVMVPILIHVGKISVHKAIGTSMFIMIATSIAGAAIKIGGGQIYLDLAIFLILGIVIGAQIGPLFAKRIDTILLQQIFGFIMIFALIIVAIGRDQLVTFIQGFFGVIF
ncbi:MAG: sulfite exporter TauE/SafE family protein [Candidatus Heimdallarchaeota archaeon]|nr:MAG: sulfite exporter TauE/SafE family protein [Candidatus Heimdallarchaeota archaeon]